MVREWMGSTSSNVLSRLELSLGLEFSGMGRARSTDPRCGLCLALKSVGGHKGAKRLSTGMHPSTTSCRFET